MGSGKETICPKEGAGVYMKKANITFIISAFLLTFMLTKTINVMQYTEEIWKDVIGYEGLYQVSNLGRIKSLPRNGTVKNTIILRTDGKLYDVVRLRKNDIPKPFLVHRLVAIAFIPNQLNKPCVNHIDGIKHNNMLSNLEWVTRSENEKHAHVTGLKDFKKDKNPARKINSEIAEKIRLKALSGLTQRSIAKEYGITQSTVCNIINRKLWA